MGSELATVVTSDGEVIEQSQPRGAAPSRVEGVIAAIESLKAIRTFVAEQLKRNLDYGVIPGTGKKPTLLLPGAQKICMYFNCWPSYEIERNEIGKGHVEYIVTTRLMSRDRGAIIGSGLGSCSTMEKKYRVRDAGRSCPRCGEPAIIRGREEYGGGWICYGKKGGCGAKFAAGDDEIEGQAGGKAENPDIYDVRNTVLKMAKKRSQVDASIGLGCLSELFTQDIEDFYDIREAEGPDPEPRPEQRTKPAPRTEAPHEAAARERRESQKRGERKPYADWLVETVKGVNETFARLLEAEGLEDDPEKPPGNIFEANRHLLKFASERGFVEASTCKTDAEVSARMVTALRAEGAGRAIFTECNRYLKGKCDERLEAIRRAKTTGPGRMREQGDESVLKAPRTAKELREWAARMDAEWEVKLKEWINKWARQANYPARGGDWTEAQVQGAFDAALAKLDEVGREREEEDEAGEEIED